jgi:CoA:oxalate CoA-transferase
VERPLACLRVLDLSRVVSGPFAGRMLADLGADVVKVEPPEGDVSRIWGEVRAGRSGFFVQQNAGKRGLCIDLKAEGAADVVLRLAREADVCIENFRPGVMARLGLAPERLLAENPRLVLLSISGFGQTGPWRDRAAYAPVVQAESGLVLRQAEQDGAAPTDPVISLADTTAGLHGLVGILAALRQRDRTGRGQHVEIAMLDALVATDDYTHHAVDGSPLVRLGGHLFETAGGPILVAGEMRHLWRQLSTVQGVVDPTPAGADLETKVALRLQAVREWFRSFSDRAEVVRALDACNLAWGDVSDQRDVVRSEHARHRGLLAEVGDGAGGPRQVVQSPYRFSDAEAGARGPAPALGEHAEEVLAEWCGATPDEVAQLRDRNVLLGG